MRSNKINPSKVKMLTLDEVLRQVAAFEGFRSRPYRCPSGVLTIGYGHTDGVKSSDLISPSDAFDVLLVDFVSCQSSLFKTFDIADCMTHNQIYALTDFVFNLGIGTLLRSSAAPCLKNYHTASSLIRKQYDAKIVSTLLKYNKYRINGKLVVSAGLQKRRQWEASLYLSS